MDGKSKNLALNYGASLEEISDAVLMEAEGIQFFDDPKVIAKISEFVEEDIAVDYSGNEPTLRVGGNEYIPGDYILRINGEFYKAVGGESVKEGN